MPILIVAIAVIIERGRILIARRHDDAPLGGLWEFPGGKCRAQETPQECAVREAFEEVGIEVIADRALATIHHVYPHAELRLHPFLCRKIVGQARPIGCQDLRWVSPDALADYSFPAANAQLIQWLIENPPD